MGRRSPHIEDGILVRIAFQRLCMAGGEVELVHGSRKGTFRLLMEAPARLVLQMSDVMRGQWELKPGVHVTLRMADRGRFYEAVVTLEGHGRFEGLEACHVSMPRQLRALDSHRMSDYVPDRPIPCTFTTLANDALQAAAIGFGEEGLELAALEGGQDFGGKLRMKAATTLQLAPEPGLNLVLPGTVSYFGEGLAGVLWRPEADPEAMKAYRAWLDEVLRTQDAKDRAGFVPKGSSAPLPSAGTEAHRVTTRPRIWSDRDPLILVLAAGEDFPRRASESLGRRFGIASLDPLRGALHPLLGELGAGLEDWGRVKLILIHHQLRSGSALEACRLLVQEEHCPLPILVGSNAEDVDLKRNRAVAFGAVDLLELEPYNVLRVIRALDDTLKLFS